METFGPGGSVVAAMLAVATGLSRHVLCFRTVWESTYAELVQAGQAVAAGGRGRTATSWQMPFGATSAAHTWRMNAQRHFHRYGTTRETLGWIALNQRANAALNPTAIYRDPLTMDDYLDRPPDHDAVRAVRLRRPVRRLGRGRSCRQWTSRATCPSRRCSSRRSAPRSSNGSTGTRAR